MVHSFARFSVNDGADISKMDHTQIQREIFIFFRQEAALRCYKNGAYGIFFCELSFALNICGFLTAISGNLLMICPVFQVK